MKSELTIHADGTKAWYLNEKYHREDGPAVEYPDGSKFWWLNGQTHREDGPAVEYPSGTKHWYVNGQRHRKDGPAIEYYDGSKHWYVNGYQLTEEQLLSEELKIDYPDLYNSYLVCHIMGS